MRATARAARRFPLWLPCLIWLLGLLALQPVQAHLMVAQRGTLNFVGSGGFVVMALPVDAFTGVDDDGDGRMSAAEMRAHSSAIEAQVQRGLQLIGDAGPRPLEGLMLNLSPDDSTPTAPAQHIVVLGRFALAEAGTDAASNLRLRFTLFGKTTEAQQQNITVSRGAQKQKMVLAPGREERALFPSAWTVLLDNAVLGAEHVVSGLDHLLFLLVVLATGWGWRRTALALTCFTIGHAISLAAVALGGLSLPASIVEPAIAATIVGMALFDRWSNARPQPLARGWRMALVFGCALIHGLGLAEALTSLGLDSTNRLLSLLGFNLGIEAAQLGIALLAGALMLAVRRLRGPAGLALATRLASFSAIAAGSVWFAQRVIVA
jgi:HupE / UreJ protein